MWNENPTRRNVLKSFGAAVIGGGLVSSQRVSALDSNRREERMRAIHKQSLDILETTHSPQKQREFLRDHGIKSTSSKHVYSIPLHGESDDVESKSSPTRDLDVTIQLIKVTDYYAVQLSFEFEWDLHDSGSHPWDIACIGWRHNHWDYQTDNIYDDTFSQGTTTLGYRKGTLAQGPDFNVDDANFSGGDNYQYCIAYLTPASDAAPEDREVFGSYTHTYNNVTIDGVGVGPKGINVTIKETTGKWTTKKERDGTILVARHSDVI